MPKMLHSLLCNVSSRYRATHCRHLDELPARFQRRILASIQEEDHRSWDNVDDFMRDLLQEIDEEEKAEQSSDYRKVAVFA